MTLLPADGASEGCAAWHAVDSSYDASGIVRVLSKWTIQARSGIQMITVQVPESLKQTGQPEQLLMAEHDNYVRPSIVIQAGEISTESLLNQAALQAILR